MSVFQGWKLAFCKAWLGQGQTGTLDETVYRNWWLGIYCGPFRQMNGDSNKSVKSAKTKLREGTFRWPDPYESLGRFVH